MHGQSHPVLRRLPPCMLEGRGIKPGVLPGPGGLAILESKVPDRACVVAFPEILGGSIFVQNHESSFAGQDCAAIPSAAVTVIVAPCKAAEGIPLLVGSEAWIINGT